MFRESLILFIGLFFCLQNINAQVNPYIYGRVTDFTGNPIPGANIAVTPAGGFVIGTATDGNGSYRMDVPLEKMLKVKFTAIGYESEERELWLTIGQLREINVMLKGNQQVLPSFTIKRYKRPQKNIVTIPPKVLTTLPSTTGGIESILPTLPGVVSNNELSSQYSVRGGSFDENLVYVNGFEVYRPFLVRSGQQEGLSFINPDLVESISFSAGGFEAKYGDKLSSVLDVTYKKPRKFAGSVGVSLLGATAHIEGKNNRFSYLLGARRKTNQYLLNALPTEGQYRPAFGDIQTFLSYDLNDNWELQGIANYATNTYRFIPEAFESSFGTFNDALRLRMFFDGQEADSYQTLMGGLGANYTSNDEKLQLRFLTSAYNSQETEAFDIIGQYLIGEVEKSLGKEDFGDITRILGVGTFHNWARNELNVNIFNLTNKGQYNYKQHLISWGAKYQHERINDALNEWERVDSAGFTLPLNPNEVILNEVLKTTTTLSSSRFTAFGQDEFTFGPEERFSFAGGLRFSYWNLNKEFLASPRFQFSFRPDAEFVKKKMDSTSIVDKDWLVRFSTGLYTQPPFYREMRNPLGVVNTNLKAQKSLHIVLGSDYTFDMWRRPFKFTSELYYKHLWDLVSYDLDNLLIRYAGENNATGFATGLDLRLNGEFVKGEESWVSLSVMNVKENLKDDHYFKYFNEEGEEVFPELTTEAPVDSTRFDIGSVPRPTDQRVTFGLFFQDHFPNNENFKMHLKLLYGTGMPFSPPNTPKLRNTFGRIPDYRRVDIGFSAVLFDKFAKNPDGSTRTLPSKNVLRHLKSIWATVEIFNLLGVDNTISYTWVKALSSNLRNEVLYAVPNHLTSRRLNARVIIKF